MDNYIPVKGDYILLGNMYSGIVLDVYWNDAKDDYICKLYLVKNAFQRNMVELHAKDTLIGNLKKSTKDVVRSEIRNRMKHLLEKLDEHFPKES